uniref:F-box domain-containing protein n=2 Tax=Panagrolaimus sp. JU765 TaxID=591449 RepID=A0AC34QKW5_9BILA
MDYFPYMKLPQLVQEMIADEIILNLDFIDQKQFILTSKYSNWLIQQSKMKKRIIIKKSRLEDRKWIFESSDNDYLSFSTEEEMIKFLKMVKFMEIDNSTIFELFFNPRFGFRSPLKDLWLDAMEFLEEFLFVLRDEYFDVNMEIVSKLNHLKECKIVNSLPSKKLLKFVDAFPKLPNFLSYDVDDELLKLLASKSNKSNPLKTLMLVPPIGGFSIDAVEQFFKRGSFVDESKISLKINASLPEVEEMFKRIGKFEVNLVEQTEREVIMMLKKIDEKIRIGVQILF